MNNAIGSKTNLGDFNNFYSLEFNDCIADLMDNELVKELEDFSQHVNTSRLQHSLNVSYYSYLVCKFFNLDFRSAARAGILHDLFLYDWREEKQPEGSHAIAHPMVALRNARTVTKLNPTEEDAIVKHMFPLAHSFPKYKESYVVSLVDKFCAVAEMTTQIKNMINEKRANHKPIFVKASSK